MVYENENNISLDRKLVADLRKTAVDRGTTLNDLICDHLGRVIGGDKAQETSASRLYELEPLERSFNKFQFRVGDRSWRREDLYERY